MEYSPAGLDNGLAIQTLVAKIPPAVLLAILPSISLILVNGLHIVNPSYQ